MDRLKLNPGLLRNPNQFSDHLYSYRVKEHFLFCTLLDNQIFVLTIQHTSMDIRQRLLVYEPTLLEEARMLHEQIKLL